MRNSTVESAGEAIEVVMLTLATFGVVVGLLALMVSGCAAPRPVTVRMAEVDQAEWPDRMRTAFLGACTEAMEDVPDVEMRGRFCACVTIHVEALSPWSELRTRQTAGMTDEDKAKVVQAYEECSLVLETITL